MVHRHAPRHLILVRLSALALLCACAPVAFAAEQHLVGPEGSVAFGTTVSALPNGRFVVVDPEAPNGSTDAAGAVYLYGPDASLISTLRGNRANDRVGSGGIVLLSGSRFLVLSPEWNASGAGRAGAVTWIDGDSGLDAVVSAGNSLVGSRSNDRVGYGGAVVLSNGNYVVVSPYWSLGSTSSVGAVTWCGGSGGCIGAVGTGNSLHGTSIIDYVGMDAVVALSNGNYAVASSSWDHAGVTDVGAVTWGNGQTGTAGAVSPANSMIGGQAYDRIGLNGLVALTNGNYVSASSEWNNGAINNAGAATWGNGSSGSVGVVSAANSLVGTRAWDLVGFDGVTALSNGHYVVASGNWSSSSVSAAGAVTWGNGSTGSAGAVSGANSLTGSVNNDQVGMFGAVALPDGNYLVASPQWNNGALWNVGAVTWVDGSGSFGGVVSAANSLIGQSDEDHVGNGAIAVLEDGNVVIASPEVDIAGVTDAGAVTWRNAAAGNPAAFSGVVTAGNSLAGSSASDRVGEQAVHVLTGSQYVVASPYWDHGAIINAGVLTWCATGSACVGAISDANSLVGSTSLDQVGSGSARVYAGGQLLQLSAHWDNGPTAGAGAVTWFNESLHPTGPITVGNSILGGVANGGPFMSFTHDAVGGRAIVGRPAENLVVLASLGDALFEDGFESP